MDEKNNAKDNQSKDDNGKTKRFVFNNVGDVREEKMRFLWMEPKDSDGIMNTVLTMTPTIPSEYVYQTTCDHLMRTDTNAYEKYREKIKYIEKQQEMIADGMEKILDGINEKLGASLVLDIDIDSVKNGYLGILYDEDSIELSDKEIEAVKLFAKETGLEIILSSCQEDATICYPSGGIRTTSEDREKECAEAKLQDRSYHGVIKEIDKETDDEYALVDIEFRKQFIVPSFLFNGQKNKIIDFLSNKYGKIIDYSLSNPKNQQKD